MDSQEYLNEETLKTLHDHMDAKLLVSHSEHTHRERGRGND